MPNNKLATSTVKKQLNIKEYTFSGTTDSNGNIYDSHLNPAYHCILNVIPTTADQSCSVLLGGSGDSWNYHISDYTNWNIGSGKSVTLKVLYYNI